jgi:FkbM family methyltransferase
VFARRLAAAAPLRPILKSPRVEPAVVAFLRASPVRQRVRFLARQLRPPREPQEYRLRSNGAVVLVRHGSPDVAALGEVFYEAQYEPPEQIAEALADLGRPPTVLDLGANVGYFSAFAATRFPGAQVVAIEPDAENVPLLRRTAAANGWAWEVVEAAATTADGEVPFAGGRFTYSRIEEGGEPVRAVDVMPFLARADFAKIDIEGGEWAILGDERFASVAPVALALEHHPYLAPDEGPDAASRRLLGAAGYAILSVLDLAPGQALVWALRRTPQSTPAP